MRQTSDGAFAFASSKLTARVVDSGKREEKEEGRGGKPVIFKTRGQVISTAGAAITGAQAMRCPGASLQARWMLCLRVFGVWRQKELGDWLIAA